MQQTFFSYSRTDSAFALRLANDLRAAGADIWMDQLDIEPGARWDAMIQDALEESRNLIVVLSEKAVTSENILDEVSYALENGRKVIPVLIEECEIPFRLRRLQYISFLESYEEGFRRLCAILNIGSIKTGGGPLPGSGADIERGPVERSRVLRNRMLIVSGALVLMLLAFFSFRQFSHKENLNESAAGFIPGIYKASPNARGQYYVLNFRQDGTVSASDWLLGADTMNKEQLIALSNWIPACPYGVNDDSVTFSFKDGGYDESYQCVLSTGNVLHCNRKAVDGSISEDVLKLVP